MGIVAGTRKWAEKEHGGGHWCGDTRWIWWRALGRGHKVDMVAGTRAETQGRKNCGHQDEDTYLTNWQAQSKRHKVVIIADNSTGT